MTGQAFLIGAGVVAGIIVALYITRLVALRRAARRRWLGWQTTEGMSEDDR